MKEVNIGERMTYVSTGYGKKWDLYAGYLIWFKHKIGSEIIENMIVSWKENWESLIDTRRIVKRTSFFLARKSICIGALMERFYVCTFFMIRTFGFRDHTYGEPINDT